MEFRQPPNSWNPLTATDEELSFYGLPPRPTEADELALWTDEFQHYSGFGAPQYCGSNGHNVPPAQRQHQPGSSWVVLSTHQGSENWSGLVVPKGSGTNFNYVYGHTYVPTMTATCSSDAHSAWVGLGGWTSPSTNLAQNGVEDDGTKLFVWYEMIYPNGGLDTKQTPITMYSGIHRGDQIAFSTQYIAPNGTTGGHFSFYVHDYATGEVEDPLVYSYAGYPAPYFYSGDTAEAIDERTMFGAYYDALRNFGVQDWVDSSDIRTSGATLNLRSEPGHFWVDMDNSAQNQILANSRIEAGSTSKEFQDEWDWCGAKELP